MAKSKSKVSKSKIAQRPPLSIGKNPSRLKSTPLQANITADEWVDGGWWVEVLSSNVEGISYNKGSQSLFVEFKGPGGSAYNTSIYMYDHISEFTAKDMFNASSMGKFVWQRLRGKFPYKRIK